MKENDTYTCPECGKHQPWVFRCAWPFIEQTLNCDCTWRTNEEFLQEQAETVRCPECDYDWPCDCSLAPSPVGVMFRDILEIELRKARTTNKPAKIFPF